MGEDATMKKCCVDEQKLKVLVLHGYKQNAETFKAKSGPFYKLIHEFADFTYLTAPHKVVLVDNANDLNDSIPDIGQSKDEEQYSWFFNRDDKTFRGICYGGPAIGFEESLKLVEGIFEREGPFDGILGFSQGACFVGLVCNLHQRSLLKFSFNFAIMGSGFKSGSLPHVKYYGERINLPSLHIIGRTDQIIPTHMSLDLSKCFEAPTVVVHGGGHYLPAASLQKSQYQKFLKDQLSRKQNREQHV